MTDCPTGKRQHKTKEIANRIRRKQVLNNIKNQRFHDGALNVYQCNVCRLWHIGHRIVKEEGN